MRQIILDTETTGLEPKQGHRIIEIGCIELINRRKTERNFHQYLNPERDIEFSFVDVIAQPEIRESLPKFSDWPTFPQVFINGELIGGCDIAIDLFEKGELQKITKEALNKSELI